MKERIEANDEIRALLRELFAEMRALRRAVTDADRQLMSRAAAARRLGVRRQDIYDWVAKGTIRSVPGQGGRPMIPQSEMERLGREGLPQPVRRGRPRGVAPPVESEEEKILKLLRRR